MNILVSKELRRETSIFFRVIFVAWALGVLWRECDALSETVQSPRLSIKWDLFIFKVFSKWCGPLKSRLYCECNLYISSTLEDWREEKKFTYGETGDKALLEPKVYHGWIPLPEPSAVLKCGQNISHLKPMRWVFENADRWAEYINIRFWTKSLKKEKLWPFSIAVSQWESS